MAGNFGHPTYQNVFSDRYHLLYRTKKRSRPAFYERINQYQKKFQIEFPKLFQQDHLMPPPWIVNKPRCITKLKQYDKNETNTNLIKTELLIILDSFPKSDKIFTDASKNNDGTGAAIVTPTSVIKFKLSKCTSIYTAELYAILQALIYIQDSDTKSHIVLSDSLSAINSLGNSFSHHPLVQRLYRVLHEVSGRGKEIVFVWIPSHIGIVGNEQADRAARAAIEDPDSILVPNSMASDFKCFIKSKLLNFWQSDWNSSTSKLRECKSSVKPWDCSLKNRKDQVIVNRLRIGHTRLTHEYILSKDNRPTCEQCQEHLSTKHILLDCPKYSAIRLKHNLKDNLQDILNKNLSNLINFLKESELLNQI